MNSNVGKLQEMVQNVMDSNGQPNYKNMNRLGLLHLLPCLSSSLVSQKYGIKGPMLSSNSACSTSLGSIINGYKMIQDQDSKLMVVGGAEEILNDIVLQGTIKIKAININDQQQSKCRPFDRTRNGIVLGEGAGILILEELEHALRRNANIFCEITGYAVNSDAHSYIQPLPSGDQVYRCMKKAVQRHRSSQSQYNDQLDQINAHATSTIQGDLAELKAIYKLVKEDLQLLNKVGVSANKVGVSANKGHIGHCFGAAGVVESILGILSIQKQKLLGVANLKDMEQVADDQGEYIEVNEYSKEMKVDVVLKNSFGFGGSNHSIVYARY